LEEDKEIFLYFILSKLVFHKTKNSFYV